MGVPVSQSRLYPGQGRALIIEEGGEVSIEWTPIGARACSQLHLGMISRAEAWLKFERIAGLTDAGPTVVGTGEAEAA